MVICLERGAHLHVAHLMPLPLTVSCFSKVQIGFAFLVLAHPGSPGQRAVKHVYVTCLTAACWSPSHTSPLVVVFIMMAAVIHSLGYGLQMSAGQGAVDKTGEIV